MTYDTWHMINYTWHMSDDRLDKVNLLSQILQPSSYSFEGTATDLPLDNYPTLHWDSFDNVFPKQKCKKTIFIREMGRGDLLGAAHQITLSFCNYTKRYHSNNFPTRGIYRSLQAELQNVNKKLNNFFTSSA